MFRRARVRTCRGHPYGLNGLSSQAGSSSQPRAPRQHMENIRDWIRGRPYDSKGTLVSSVSSTVFSTFSWQGYPCVLLSQRTQGSLRGGANKSRGRQEYPCGASPESFCIFGKDLRPLCLGTLLSSGAGTVSCINWAAHCGRPVAAPAGYSYVLSRFVPFRPQQESCVLSGVLYSEL